MSTVSIVEATPSTATTGALIRPMNDTSANNSKSNIGFVIGVSSCKGDRKMFENVLHLIYFPMSNRRRRQKHSSSEPRLQSVGEGTQGRAS